jgi:hypothetical protein
MVNDNEVPWRPGNANACCQIILNFFRDTRNGVWHAAMTEIWFACTRMKQVIEMAAWRAQWQCKPTLIALPSAFVYQFPMRYLHATLFPRLCLQQSVPHVRLRQPKWLLILLQRLHRLWSPPCQLAFFFFAYPKRQHHPGGEEVQIAY